METLDRDAVVQALTQADGHLGKAAGALAVKTADLRAIVRGEPQLMDAALDAVEQAVDQAESELLKAMRKGQLSNRLQAAAYIVRRSRR